jgi:hypothetical protein
MHHDTDRSVWLLLCSSGVFGWLNIATYCMQASDCIHHSFIYSYAAHLGLAGRGMPCHAIHAMGNYVPYGKINGNNQKPVRPTWFRLEFVANEKNKRRNAESGLPL